MNKLKLEDLEVTSFDTSPAATSERGTVHARSEPTETHPIDRCGGPTEYFGCTMEETCPNWCMPPIDTDVDCYVVVDP